MLAFVLFALFSVTFQWADAETSYTCDFERDTCGFTNEEGLSAIWVRKELKLGGKKVFGMILEVNETDVQKGRMMTPYFEIEENIPGCFSFDYYVSGEGVRSFSVEQESDHGILPAWISNKFSSPRWQKTQFDVNIDESLRFFFTALVDPSVGENVIAMSNMKLKLSKC